MSPAYAYVFFHKKAFFRLAMAAFLAIELCMAISGEAKAQPHERLAWIRNDDMLLLYEALAKAQEIGLRPGSPHYAIQEAIRTYLRGMDQFSDYLSPLQYADYKRAQNKSFGGVGMDIWADRSGKIICIPFPGKPAARSGIEYGDQLVKVDGTDICGKSIYSIGAIIRGKVGTKARLTIRKDSGESKTIALVRQPIVFKSVLILENEPFPTIKILRFTNQTYQELRDALKEIGFTRTKILDLRGNTGGDLFSAIDSASLFLMPGKKIISLQTRSGIKPYVNKVWPLDRNSSLFILQDKLSASAAEVFIAALTQNGRAISIGKRTFGKGLAQKIVELADGSAMFLSYALIVGPNGFCFNKKGLWPTYREIAVGNEKDGGYVPVVRKLLKQQRQQLETPKTNIEK